MVDNVTVAKTPLAGVMIIRNKRFHDSRGFFVESYSKEGLKQLGIDVEFVQDNLSFNINPFTLRGLHFQRAPFAQAKLVSVIKGSALDVVVDLRRSSPTFGKHFKVVLNATDGDQLFVPAAFAHGYLTHEPETLFSYKVAQPYSPEHEGGLCFDDSLLGIDWATRADQIITSTKDRAWPAFDPGMSYFK